MEDLKKIQEFFSKPLEENVDKKYNDFLVALRDSGITNMFGAAPYLQAEFGLDKREAREVLANWMKSFNESLNEVSGDIDLEDFAKVVQAVHQTDHPATLLLSPMFGKDEIEIIVGQDAPDSIIDDIFNVMTDLGYKSGTDYSIVGDTSSLSRRSYSQIRRVNGGHKNYFEESLDEVNDPRIDNPKFGPSPKKFAELRAQMGDEALLDKIQMMDVNVLVDVLDELDLAESLDEAYIVTYAKNKGEKPSSVAYKLRGSALAFMRDLEKDGYITMLTQKPVDGVDEATKEEENEFHKELDKLVHKTFGHSSDEKEKMKEYNSGIYYDPVKSSSHPKVKQASKSALERVKDMLKKAIKEDLSDFEEKEADYDDLYSDYLYKMVKEVAAEKGYSKFLVSKDNPKGETSGLDTKTMNKILMNVIKDLDELKQLGEGVIEEELCPKGKAYIKKRQAAGEKSSAYLSGRAVKVCKGQMKG